MTVQTYDLIIDDGRQRVLMSEPLKTYKDLPRFQSIASNNHKGYEAIWTICQKRLFLIHLNGFGEGQPGTPEDEGDLSGGASITLETLFANHRGPVSANWFTGTLRIGHGRIAASLMEGWPLFEFEDEVELVNGAVINRKCYARKIGHQMQAPIVYSTLELLELPKEVQRN